MLRKRLCAAIAVVSLALCSACALLPEEETPRVAPVLKSYQSEEFKFAFATVGDVILSEKISVTYVPVRSEALRFKVGGEYIDDMFVKVGDSVVGGQLLGQLRLEGVQDEIKTCEGEIDRLRLRAAQLEEDRALAIRRAQILSEDKTASEARESIARVNETYDSQKQSIADSEMIKRLELEALNEKLAERQVRASFDGTVTYVKSFAEGAVSVKGDRVATVADSTLSLFRAETKLWELFAPGDEHVITVNKIEYPAIVAGEEELGLEAGERVAGENAFVYFKLKEPAFDLEDGDRGALVMVLDERLNVLTLDSSAIATSSGEPIVYYQKDDGMKAYKRITTGLTNGKITEITSGLSEGESVIVD